MRKLILWNVITLDGYFEGSKPWDLSFHELVWGPELVALSIKQLQEADMIIFGKNTYLGMADYWPYADSKNEDGIISERMNNIHKIVCSNTLKTADWNNTEIINDAVTGLTTLKAEGNNPMYIFGSGNLTESLLKANLIDEVRLCIAPILLGNGRHLFNTCNRKHNLRLLENTQLSSGGIFVKYEVLKSNY